MGNVLAVSDGPEPDLAVVDFNRARIRQRPGVYDTEQSKRMITYLYWGIVIAAVVGAMTLFAGKMNNIRLALIASAAMAEIGMPPTEPVPETARGGTT